MKIVLSFLCLAFVGCLAAVSDKQKEMALALLKECQEKEGASDDDVKAFQSYSIPSSKEGQCIIACMNEKIGIFVDGKFNKPGFLAAAKMMFEGNEKVLDAAEGVGDECGSIEGTDRCDLGIKYSECMAKALKARNLELEFA